MDLPKVDLEICTGCGNCIEICPVEALRLVDGIALIDSELCTNCRICESECPVEAIN